MTSFEPAIAARDLALIHPGAQGPVIEGLDLALAPGEIVAILGPSGSGKSSLLRALAGLDAPAHGAVLVDGRRLDGVHPRIALAFQDPGLLPWLNVEKNVAFGLDFKRQLALSRDDLRARVDWALRAVDLDHARRLHPPALSGGMAQRAALARCLARRPSVLLLDEPFGALDEVTRADMQRLLLRVVADVGAAALIVTHDLDEVSLLADRVLLLGGTPARIVEEWRVVEPRPRDDAVAALAPLRTAMLAALRRTMRQREPAYA